MKVAIIFSINVTGSITGEYADEDERLAQHDVEGTHFNIVDKYLFSNLILSNACFYVGGFCGFLVV